MDVLHITQTKHIPSIMKTGIHRSKPILDQYDKVMEYDYGSDYDKEKGLVFGISENINRRDKYIKDFFYWKTWGEKRNIFLKELDYNQYETCLEIGPDVFSHIKIEPINFSILLIDIPYKPIYDYYRHEQSADMSSLWTDMDVRYEHNDKPLVLMNYDVKPCNIKKIVGEGESILGKNNKIDVTLKM